MSKECEPIPSTKEVADQTSYISDAILLIIGLLILNEVLVNKFNNLKKRIPKLIFINESMITTTIGLLAGFGMQQVGAGIVMEQIKDGFGQIFMIVLLPPILFESAIHMDTTTFFQHFGTINLYAIIGTVIAMLFTSFFLWFAGIFEIATALPISVCFGYGAIISATDPVAVLSAFKDMSDSKMLYTIIFGESILNDSVAIILFQYVNLIIRAVIQIETNKNTQLYKIMLQFGQVFFSSIIIGYIVGILSAIILKQKFQTMSDIEMPLLMLLPWVTYLVSEGLGMSGIVSIIFCGIAMARYTMPHITEQNLNMFKSLYQQVSHIFENAVFIFIGIGIIGFDLAWRSMGSGLLIVCILGILIGRLANVLIISNLTNHYRKLHKLNKHQIFILWFSGLRGAMAYALSLQGLDIYNYDNIGNILLTVTLSIIMINIFISGALLEPMLLKYREQLKEDYQDEQENVNQDIFRKLKDVISNIDNLFISICLIDNDDEQIQVLEDDEEEQN